MTEAATKACISVRHLDFYYNKFHALKDINLEIPGKQVTALIGPSGCGKSTLLRVFNRIYAIYPRHTATGEVLLENQNILDPKCSLALLRGKVGMVFQKPVPFPMTIYENIAYGVRHYETLSRRELDECVEKALRDAVLWDETRDILRQSALMLSGGQQQRLCIARAIALKPQVLLMDEPTSALDPVSTAKIESLIYEIKKDYTVVIVTHNMQQATRCSDFTAFMYLGKLVEAGQTAQLFNNPEHKQTEDYISGRFG